MVATAAIRAQYRGRLASVYAPAVIASFGSGNARIDIRQVFPGGTAKYRIVQRAALRARKAADAQLLTNRHITCSVTARTQLLSGYIDPRLPLLLAYLAYAHKLRIVDFGDRSPGGGPASLLRSVDLAAVDPAGHLTPTAYLRWMQTFIHAQRAQYRPARSQQATLRSGGRAADRLWRAEPAELTEIRPTAACTGVEHPVRDLVRPVPQPGDRARASALARLTRQFGLPALDLAWRQATGHPVPQAVRDYLISPTGQ